MKMRESKNSVAQNIIPVDFVTGNIVNLCHYSSFGEMMFWVDWYDIKRYKTG